MRYKKAKKIVIEDFNKNMNVFIDFGWKFRWYLKMRKSMKGWAKEILKAK